MINAALISETLEDELAQRGLFLVEVMVRPGNRIAVYIDSMSGVTLEECIAVNRFLESRLDRNVEDYELEVSSPGLDKPLKLPVQFEKNTGKVLDVLKTDGIKVTGKLAGIDREAIIIETEGTVRDSKTGRKRREMSMQEIRFDSIKTAKVIISLKK
jgi:ribosome maturation factor RimP